MSYTSTKVIPLGSCAFRQPFATSHCKFIHGYRLQAKFWFACNELDSNNWVVDFGGLKDLKKELEETFDHTLCVSNKDPELPIFKMLHDKGVVDLRILDGVGIEKFAELCLKKADVFVKNLTNERCWCSKVEVWEHEGNSACFESNHKDISTKTPTEILQNITNQITVPKPEAVSVKQTPDTPTQPVVAVEEKPQTPPLHTKKTTNTYKGLFDGTSWGAKK